MRFFSRWIRTCLILSQVIFSKNVNLGANLTQTFFKIHKVARVSIFCHSIPKEA